MAEPDMCGRRLPEFVTRHWLGRRHEVCVIIPVVNEGERLLRLLAKMSDPALAIPNMADIIIVDGGSTDESLAQTNLDAHDVRGLLVKTGAGKLSAQLRCAYAFALDQGYTGLITIDGNDKDDPAAIPRFINALRQGFDFVQASRFLPGGVHENTPRMRGFAIRLLHAPLLSLSSGFRWTDTTQGFRAYSSRILLDKRVAPFRDVFTGYELLAYLSHRVPRLKYRCVELPTARVYPKGSVPTKVQGWRGNVQLLQVLCRACLGLYDPTERAP